MICQQTYHAVSRLCQDQCKSSHSSGFISFRERSTPLRSTPCWLSLYRILYDKSVRNSSKVSCLKLSISGSCILLHCPNAGNYCESWKRQVARNSRSRSMIPPRENSRRGHGQWPDPLHVHNREDGGGGGFLNHFMAYSYNSPTKHELSSKGHREDDLVAYQKTRP